MPFSMRKTPSRLRLSARRRSPRSCRRSASRSAAGHEFCPAPRSLQWYSVLPEKLNTTGEEMALDVNRPDLVVGVVGTGAMGRGIAQVTAQGSPERGGMKAILFD